MSIKEQEERELGKFTLEEAKQLIFRVEDMASSEQSFGKATRFFLMQLLKAMHRAKAINAISFLEDMDTDHTASERQLEEFDRVSLQLMVQAMLQEFRQEESVAPH